MNIIELTITNIHERGFAFGVSEETAEQCFIPPHVLDGSGAERGDTVTVQVVTNPNERQRENTRWCAINIVKGDDTEVKSEASPVRSMAALDDEVLDYISAEYYVSTPDIARAIEVDVKTAGNSAYRLFNAGKIAKADVYGKVGLQRPSFILWAKTAMSFVEVDQ